MTYDMKLISGYNWSQNLELKADKQFYNYHNIKQHCYPAY